MKTRRTKQTRYEIGQHRLICQALGISHKGTAPGLTAYEAVCVLLGRLDDACEAMLTDDDMAQMRSIQRIKKPVDCEDEFVIRMY